VPYFQVWIKDWASSAWTRLRTYNLSSTFSTNVPSAGYYQFWVEATTNKPNRQASGYSSLFEVKGACSNLRITGTSQGGGWATIGYASDETLPGTAHYQVWLRLPSGAWQLCRPWSTNPTCTVDGLTPDAWYQWYIEMRAGSGGARVGDLYGAWFKP
jgi:hypothetical protein